MDAIFLIFGRFTIIIIKYGMETKSSKGLSMPY